MHAAGAEVVDLVRHLLARDVEANRRPVDTEHPLNAVLSQFGPGQIVTLQILRDGNPQNVSVTLGTRPPDL